MGRTWIFDGQRCRCLGLALPFLDDINAMAESVITTTSVTPSVPQTKSGRMQLIVHGIVSGSGRSTPAHTS
uniref:Uncharacterized protein n=1 Tax=Salix viminalis TaxID=40686 RepID=A0A6N2MWP7_SALVM